MDSIIYSIEIVNRIPCYTEGLLEGLTNILWEPHVRDCRVNERHNSVGQQWRLSFGTGEGDRRDCHDELSDIGGREGK